MKAIENAELKDFVDNLPDGIQTIVGENGINISGGKNKELELQELCTKIKIYIFLMKPQMLWIILLKKIFTKIFSKIIITFLLFQSLQNKQLSKI